MKKILVAIGTRPDSIKMYPLIKELKKRQRFDVAVVSSGQHREMLLSELSSMSFGVDRDLQIMNIGQTLFDITAKILSGMRAAFEELLPDIVLVHGDTATAFATSLAAFYMKIPIGHIEAGLRTYNIDEPYPEEFYRRAIAPMARYHFAPTTGAGENLMREGIDKRYIFVTGNTAIDAIKDSLKCDFSHPLLDGARGKKIIIFTAHRRESRDYEIRGMLRAVRRLCAARDDISVIYPIHKNDTIRKIASEELTLCSGVVITEPIESKVFHNILARSYLIMTDSGGVQEEASFLGIPTLVMRNTTERKEILSNLCVKVIGKDEDAIYNAAITLLENENVYRACAKATDIFGDGFASCRIADVLEKSVLEC